MALLDGTKPVRPVVLDEEVTTTAIVRRRPVAPLRTPMWDTEGSLTRPWATFFASLEELLAGIAAAAAGLRGPYVRTLDLVDLTPGAAIAPLVPVWEPGPGIRVIGVLRKTISADLVVEIRRNDETSPLITFTLPASTPVGVDVVSDISDISLLDLDVLIADITASDSSSDPDGVATITIEWGTHGAGDDDGTGGGGTGGGGFTAGGDLAGTPTDQTVVGIEGVPLDAATVGSPEDGQVLVYDDASGRYMAKDPAAGFVAGGDLSGTATDQIVTGLAGIPLDASVAIPTDGQILAYDAASGSYQAVDPPTGGGGTGGLVIGFGISDGSPGTNVGPMLQAPRNGTLTKCVATVKTSDSLIAMNWDIKRAGVSVFATTPTIAAGAATGSTFTFTTLAGGSLAVTAGEVFSMDILTGSAAWQFTTQLEQ